MLSFANYLREARENIIAASRKRFPSGYDVARSEFTAREFCLQSYMSISRGDISVFMAKEKKKKKKKTA